jgi:Fur family transcriptional regulator, ferric uptake regulator
MVASIKHDCKIELKDVKLRATPARLHLMYLLETTDKPLDVQTMIDYLKENNIETDPATVFRIVNTFTEKGLTKQIQFQEGKFRYELASKAEHHHLVCTRCGQIQDISDCNIDVLESHIEKKKKFKVISHALEFYGICEDCQK